MEILFLSVKEIMKFLSRIISYSSD